MWLLQESGTITSKHELSSKTIIFHILIINPRRACARGLQYLSCLCVCVFPIPAPRAIRRTNSSISDFSAIRA